MILMIYIYIYIYIKHNTGDVTIKSVRLNSAIGILSRFVTGQRSHEGVKSHKNNFMLYIYIYIYIRVGVNV